MKKHSLLLSVLFLSAACAHAPAPAAFGGSPEPITAEGSAPLAGQGPARERASLDAQRSAVLRAAGLFMDESARAGSRDLLEIGLLRTPQLYVAKARVLSEQRDGDSVRVAARVWLRLDKLVSALRGLKLAGPGAASAEAAFAQRGPGGKPFYAAFSEAFTKRSAFRLRELKADEGLLAGPDAALAEAAAADGADLLLVAASSVSQSGPGLDTGFYPARAEASLKVYGPDGAELLSLSSQANAVDSAEAASAAKALANAADLLAQEAAVRTARLNDKPAPVTIKVAGVGSLDRLERLRDQLQGPELSGLRVESFSDGNAVISAVPARSDLHEMASALLRTDALGLELEGVGPGQVVFSIPN
ncbi:MAG: hypothetical protein M0025_06370 [Elusimicrobia bacterium]|nr:hypothetical protein [Elusimicrobiota bacterium]